MPNLEPIKVTEQMTRDIESFLHVRGLLTEVMEAAKNEQPASNVAVFARNLSARIGKNAADVFSVVDLLKNLKATEIHSGQAPDDLILDLTKSLEISGSPWDKPPTIRKWKDTAPKLAKALKQINQDSGLMLSAKIAGLVYCRQNILHTCNIISDIRPVFNQSAKEISGMVVTHSLVLYYSDETKTQHELHLTMDWRDVARLRELCERANVKAQVIVDSLRDKPWNTVAYPEQIGE
jgi:hypothetical protein